MVVSPQVAWMRFLKFFQSKRRALRTKITPFNEVKQKEVIAMKGYWTEYSYVGFMPNGEQREFANRQDYVEAYLEALDSC